MSREAMKLDTILDELTALKETVAVQTAEIKAISILLSEQQIHPVASNDKILQTQVEIMKYEMTQINRNMGLLCEDINKGRKKNIFNWF
jgi:hypothetical protein